jgi:hypothetical protein
MERDKAAKVLAGYWQAVIDAGSERWLSAQRSGAVAALNSKLPAVNRILLDLAPDLALIAAASLGQHRSARAVLDRAEAILNAWERLDEARTGDGPALPLVMLDPVIAATALPLWKVGKYRQAPRSPRPGKSGARLDG